MIKVVSIHFFHLLLTGELLNVGREVLHGYLALRLLWRCTPHWHFENSLRICLVIAFGNDIVLRWIHVIVSVSIIFHRIIPTRSFVLYLPWLWMGDILMRISQMSLFTMLCVFITIRCQQTHILLHSVVWIVHIVGNFVISILFDTQFWKLILEWMSSVDWENFGGVDYWWVLSGVCSWDSQNTTVVCNWWWVCGKSLHLLLSHWARCYSVLVKINVWVSYVLLVWVWNLRHIIKITTGFVVSMRYAILRFDMNNFFEFILTGSKRTVLLTSTPSVTRQFGTYTMSLHNVLDLFITLFINSTI